MSRIVNELKNKQQELINNRSQLKDQLEAIEKSLGQIGFALQTQEAIFKIQEEENQAAAEEMEADMQSEPSNN